MNDLAGSQGIHIDECIQTRAIVLPNGLLVVHERFVELPLLLEDGRQVGVRRRELGKHLQGLQVQPVKEECVLDLATRG